MKPLVKTFAQGMALLPMLLLLHIPAHSQDQVAGHWEGTFMGDFRTVIELNAAEEEQYTGRILMFSGENVIQEDPLSNIQLESSTLTFRIDAKETGFKGTFNGDCTELAGHFIFPDGSEHSLVVKRGEGTVRDSSAPQESYLDASQKRYPAEALTADSKFLMETLKAHHPLLYGYTPAQTMEGLMDDLLMGLDSELTLEEYYLRVAPLVQMVGCSHTGMRLPEDYQRLMRQQGLYFPASLFFNNGPSGYSARCAAPGTGLPPGSEVASINEVPVNLIVERLLSLIPSEGLCKTTKFHEINRNFRDYFKLLDSAATFSVEYLTPGGSETVVLQGCRFEEITTMPWIKDPVRPVELTTHAGSGLATLRVASFEFMDVEGYIALMDSLFRSFHKSGVSHLVLDLRANSGGHPIFAAQLLSYLSDHEFTYFKPNPAVESFEPLYHAMQPNPLRFEGKLYVLVDGGCLSTTGHLISLLKYHTGALFIGEEPGSTFRCNDFSIQVALPNTGIQVNVPRTTFETAVSGFSDEIPFPLDARVETSVNDIIAEDDPYMAQVYLMIGATGPCP